MENRRRIHGRTTPERFFKLPVEWELRGPPQLGRSVFTGFRDHEDLTSMMKHQGIRKMVRRVQTNRWSADGPIRLEGCTADSPTPVSVRIVLKEQPNLPLMLDQKRVRIEMTGWAVHPSKVGFVLRLAS